MADFCWPILLADKIGQRYRSSGFTSFRTLQPPVKKFVRGRKPAANEMTRVPLPPEKKLVNSTHLHTKLYVPHRLQFTNVLNKLYHRQRLFTTNCECKISIKYDNPVFFHDIQLALIHHTSPHTQQEDNGSAIGTQI